MASLTLSNGKSTADTVFPSSPDSVERVPGWVASQLDGHGLTVTHTVAAVAARLVASAVEHGTGESVDVRLVHRFGTIWCQVGNDTPHTAHHLKPLVFDGEPIKRWGYSDFGDGRLLVWFEVPIDARRGRAGAPA